MIRNPRLMPQVPRLVIDGETLAAIALFIPIVFVQDATVEDGIDAHSGLRKTNGKFSETLKMVDEPAYSQPIRTSAREIV